jgi:predicted metalloprotease
MTKVYIAGIVVVVGAIAFFSSNNSDRMSDETSTENKEKVVKNDEIKNQNVSFDNVSKKTQTADNKSVKVISEDTEKNSYSQKSNTNNKPTPQKDKIVSYQKVYEYIQDKQLKPMFEEPKTDKNGNKYNIYYKESSTASSSGGTNSMMPPMMPKLVSIAGTTIAVPADVSQVYKSIENNDDTTLESYEITEDGAKKDDEVVVFSTPPQIGQSL